MKENESIETFNFRINTFCLATFLVKTGANVNLKFSMKIKTNSF